MVGGSSSEFSEVIARANSIIKVAVGVQHSYWARAQKYNQHAYADNQKQKSDALAGYIGIISAILKEHANTDKIHGQVQKEQ